MLPLRWIAALALAVPVAAQPVAPARAGLISFTEANVSVDGRPVWVEPARFPEVTVGGVLRTEAGRAEVLLAPCAALRIAENSSFRLLANAVAATRVELLSGSAIVDIGELPRGAALTVIVGQTAAPMTKVGSYRFDAVSPAAAPAKLGKKPADAFESWSVKRSADQAKASGAARNQAQQARTLAAAANAAANTEPVPNPDRYPTSARDAGAPSIFTNPARIAAYGATGCVEPK
jgi:hypothetical protein